MFIPCFNIYAKGALNPNLRKNQAKQKYGHQQRLERNNVFPIRNNCTHSVSKKR